MIASERDSWQRKDRRFLCTQLPGFNLKGPFLIRNSEAFIEPFSAEVFYSRGFSIDIEYLFSSIRYHKLIPRLKSAEKVTTWSCGGNSSGRSVEIFIEVVTCCLDYTLVSFQGELFVQMNRICIGSGVAPVLCDNCLAAFGRSVLDGLETKVY